MPPKPFPYPIGIGVDISLIPRMRRLITERNGRNIIPLARRIFHRGSELGSLKKRLGVYKEQAGDQSLSSAQASENTSSFARWMAARFDVPCNGPAISLSHSRLRWTLLTYCK